MVFYDVQPEHGLDLFLQLWPPWAFLFLTLLPTKQNQIKLMNLVPHAHNIRKIQCNMYSEDSV